MEDVRDAPKETKAHLARLHALAEAVSEELAEDRLQALVSWARKELAAHLLVPATEVEVSALRDGSSRLTLLPQIKQVPSSSPTSRKLTGLPRRDLLKLEKFVPQSEAPVEEKPSSPRNKRRRLAQTVAKAAPKDDNPTGSKPAAQKGGSGGSGGGASGRQRRGG